MHLSTEVTSHIRTAATSLKCAARLIEQDDPEGCDVVCSVLDDMRSDLEEML